MIKALSRAIQGVWACLALLLLLTTASHAAPAPHVGQWMVRPSGQAGEVIIEVRALKGARQGASLQARHVAVDAQFRPLAAWSSWHVLDPSIGTGGQYRLDGLSGPGTTSLVELRLLSEDGHGPASSPKRAWTQALAFPQTIVLGGLNPAGTGRIRIPKDATISTVSAGQASDWRVETGPSGWDYAVATRDGADLPPTVTLDLTTEQAESHRVEINLAPRTFTAETAQEVAQFISQPSDVLSGATLLIGAEWIDTGAEDFFRNRLVGLADPLVIRPREPAHGTLISKWSVFMTGPSMVGGNLHLEGLTFYYPEFLAGKHQVRKHPNILDFAKGNGRTTHVRVRDCVLMSDAMPGRMGYQLNRLVRGIYLKDVTDSKVENCDVSHMLYGIAVGTNQSLIRGNTIHHMGADPLNIFFSKGTTVRDVTIEHNTVHDFMGDAWKLHGDALHMWMTGGGEGDGSTLIDGLRYRGNVAFPGYEGMRVPPRLRPAFKTVYFTHSELAGGRLSIGPEHKDKIIRIDASAGPVEVLFPAPADAPGLQLAIQKTDQGPHPVILVAAPNTTLGTHQSISLRNPWQALEMGTTKKDGSPVWWLKVPVPAFQGFFADNNDVPLRGLEIEGNIIWGMSPWQVAPRNRPQDGAWVHHNSLITPFPGDLDGDGRFNTRWDAATTSSGRVELGAWDGSAGVWANIAGRYSVPKGSPMRPDIWNNSSVPWSKHATVSQIFPAAQQSHEDDPRSIVWAPTTRAEAISMARPAPDSEIALAGRGALGHAPEHDWWDFETGTRKAAGLAALTTRFLRPSQDGASISVERPSLELHLSEMAAAGEGTLELKRTGTAEVLQRWDLAAARPAKRAQSDTMTPMILGRQLRLPLATPLPEGDLYVAAAPGAQVVLRDIWGQELPFAEAVPDGLWRFKANPNAAVNRLGSADPAHPWWGARGWRNVTASTGVEAYVRQDGAPGRRLRLDANQHPILWQSGTWTLRFDYGPVSADTNLRTEILFPKQSEKVVARWQKMRPGQSYDIGSGMVARRQDVSAEYGLSSGRIWAAELTWTVDKPPRRIIDLLQGAPDGRNMLVGRLSLYKGGPGKEWTEP